MNRKYHNCFRYAGMTRLDHCEGPDWDEVWEDPAWVTKPITAHRAKFLWTAIQKECPWLIPGYSHPHVVAGRRYRLEIVQDDQSGEHGHWLWICRV